MKAPELSGTIFNIQKFSLNDGPGIRTVVFFKGCPLHCRWCANPESQSAHIQILWDAAKCLHCGHCAQICPGQAICWKEKQMDINEKNCDGCGDTYRCVTECPAEALSCEGKRQTVSEIVTVCLQDWDFYEESGGGVTLSGGEALMQPDFAVALLKELHKAGIHTAIETTGYAVPEVFDRVTAHSDLLLFDIKHWNAERHRVGTGVRNEQILDNMRRAIAAGKDVLPRLPVIPGFNDSLKDARGFVRCLSQAGATRVQLLPFHQFGENKYALLGREYAYAGKAALHAEELTEFQAIFTAGGMEAFF